MFYLSNNAIQYTVQQLLRIVGLNLNFGRIKISIPSDNSRVIVEIVEDKLLVFKLMNEKEIDQLLKGELSLKKILSFDAKVNVPVVLIDHGDNFASVCDGRLLINADIITLSFVLLSRYEETNVPERDQYNRFQFKNSLAYKYDFIDIPIVDEYAMLLRQWLLTFIPTLSIIKRKGKIIPTHDIDGIQRFGNLSRNIQTIIMGDLFNRRSLPIAYKSFKQCLKAVINTKKDPFILAIELLISISKQAGLSSIFYFMGQRLGQYDARYDIFDPNVKYCMDLITNAGMIIGMHGGYDSYDNEEIFQTEKENIESVYGQVINMGRQHLLRFAIHKTLQIWQNFYEFKDSTLGYSEREGFRCGTCHEYYLYDLKNDCISTVKEHPLIVMDITLFEFSGHNTEKALAKIEELYARCQAVEGDFLILWHNYLVHRDYEIRFKDVYCKFLDRIS